MFQDFAAREVIAPRSNEPALPVVEATELINRYPNLSETELARLINLYAHLSALDAALIVSDKKLGPKLDRFFADHRSKIRTPVRHYAALLGIAMGGIFVAAWALAFAA